MLKFQDLADSISIRAVSGDNIMYITRRNRMSDLLLSYNITIIKQLLNIIIFIVVWIITRTIRINKTVIAVETFVCIQKTKRDLIQVIYGSRN